MAQVHDIPPRARSSKRAVRLISGIALDECRDPERYRTCAPTPSADSQSPIANRQGPTSVISAIGYWSLAIHAKRATPEREAARAVPSAGCEPVEETGQGFLQFRLVICDLRLAAVVTDPSLFPSFNPESTIGNRKSQGGCGSTAEHGHAKAETTVRLRSPAPWLRSRASAQAGLIRPLRPGRHRGLRPLSPPGSSLLAFVVRKSCRGSTGGRLQFPCSCNSITRAQPAEG